LIFSTQKLHTLRCWRFGPPLEELSRGGRLTAIGLS
jgi:hypothetical protein